MGKLSEPPANLSTLIDRIEQVREELLTIQRSIETLESTALASNIEAAKQRE
jgi:hypothetical protein